MHDSERPRCSDAARLRADPLLATAPTARRLLLIEVPGPWGRPGLTGSRLAPDVAAAVAARAETAGVRVQLIRRPGRHPGPRLARPGAGVTAPEAAAAEPGGPFAWALAEPDSQRMTWGSWQHERDLLRIDPAGPLDAATDPGAPRVALVCTHARHDVCCALLGRPVAAAVAAGTDRQTWETSHLGGDRFAANLLLLPEGEVFGRLDGAGAVAAVRALAAGRLDLPHYRGRVGRAPIEQAGLHLVAQALDDDGLGAVRVLDAQELEGDRWALRIEHRGRRHRAAIASWWAEPALLSCSAAAAKPARRFALESIELDDEEAGRWQLTR